MRLETLQDDVAKKGLWQRFLKCSHSEFSQWLGNEHDAVGFRSSFLSDQLFNLQTLFSVETTEFSSAFFEGLLQDSPLELLIFFLTPLSHSDILRMYLWSGKRETSLSRISPRSQVTSAGWIFPRTLRRSFPGSEQGKQFSNGFKTLSFTEKSMRHWRLLTCRRSKHLQLI